MAVFCRLTKAIPVLFAVLVALLPAQTNRGEDILFHVTSVSQADANDYCTTGTCSATRITVGGYTTERDASIEYVLDCVEVIANEPKPHFTTQCIRLHAHGDYSAKLYIDSISFNTEPSSSSDPNKPTVIDYSIKSEKEVRKK